MTPNYTYNFKRKNKYRWTLFTNLQLAEKYKIGGLQ